MTGFRWCQSLGSHSMPQKRPWVKIGGELWLSLVSGAFRMPLASGHRGPGLGPQEAPQGQGVGKYLAVSLLLEPRGTILQLTWRDQAQGLKRLPRDNWVGEHKWVFSPVLLLWGSFLLPTDLEASMPLLMLEPLPFTPSATSHLCQACWASTSLPAPCSPLHPTWLLRGSSHLPDCLRSPTRVWWVS